MKPWFGRGPAAPGSGSGEPWPPALRVREPDHRPRRRTAQAAASECRPRGSGEEALPGVASMTRTSFRASGPELGPTRLCEVRAGDGVRLVEAEGKEARLWLLLAGWVEEQSVEVLRAGRGGVVLSIEERNVTVPGWVARTTLVDCTRRFKTKSTREERP